MRDKLRGYAERLIIPPSQFSRKGEDLVWKKVFYDVIMHCRATKTHQVRRYSGAMFISCALKLILLKVWFSRTILENLAVIMISIISVWIREEGRLLRH